jgi:two-component system, NtrC family, sensor kinase
MSVWAKKQRPKAIMSEGAMIEEQKEKKPGTSRELASFSCSDDWLRGLVEQTLAGIYLIQDDCFRYVNQGFANIFGYGSPAEIIDTLKIDTLVAPENRQMVAQDVRRRASGEEPEMRYSFIGLLLDVTERKLAEAVSDEKLGALFELSPLGIALVDMQGRVVAFNDTYPRLLGYLAEALQKMDYMYLRR